jgi:CDP-6-deoxy-D-xylo-4-hexulose-3-dehydrase
MDLIEEISKRIADHMGHHKKTFFNGKVPVSGKVYDENELINLVKATLEGWWTEGKWSADFEEELKHFLGIKKILLTNSGSSANLIALKTLSSISLGEKRIKPGDEVITVAAAFPTTINPIIQSGAVPVFVDVDLDTANANLSILKKAVSKRQKLFFWLTH